MKEPPPTIFKYHAFTLQAIQSLKRHSVWFGTPAHFNDPYDSAARVTIKEPTISDIEEVRDYYLTFKEDVAERFKREIEQMSIPELGKFLVRVAHEETAKHLEQLRIDSGITCFTECNDNLLMWAHYGGSHTGFCLEFDTQHEPFNKMQAVTYAERFPEIGVELIAKEQYQLCLEAFCTKSSHWAYEREWRSLNKKHSQPFTYKPDALKAVYFGMKCDFQDKDLIACILHVQAPHVKLYSGEMSDTEFKVEFKEVRYDPAAARACARQPK